MWRLGLKRLRLSRPRRSRQNIIIGINIMTIETMHRLEMSMMMSKSLGLVSDSVSKTCCIVVGMSESCRIGADGEGVDSKEEAYVIVSTNMFRSSIIVVRVDVAVAMLDGVMWVGTAVGEKAWQSWSRTGKQEML